MVNVPPLPTAADKEPLSVVEEPNARPAHITRVGEAFELLDSFNAEQLADVHLWLAEHPVPGFDAVRIALGAVNALTQNELLLFIDALKQTIEPDLWVMLTELDDARNPTE